MKLIKIIFCTLFVFSIIGIVGLFFAYREMSHYEIQSYKPFPFPSEDKPDDRFAYFQTKFGEIGIEWNTYDNRNINESPYKITFRMDDFQNLNFVSLEQIIISSSKGKNYTVLLEYKAPGYQNENIKGNRSYTFPIKFDENHKYQTIEPSFHFDFLGDEKIRTIIVMSAQLKTGEIVKDTLSIDWHPITVDKFAPLV